MAAIPLVDSKCFWEPFQIIETERDIFALQNNKNVLYNKINIILYN